MKLNLNIRSEEGAATVLEATIVYPVVFLVVVLLVFVGFTYGQQGFLAYHTQNLSSYIAKVICYPGYNFITSPDFEKTGKNEVTFDDINNAMNAQAPYRYLFGTVGTQYKNAEDESGDDIIKGYVEVLTNDYLTTHGFLKSSGGDVAIPDKLLNETSPDRIGNKNGYACAISATSTKVTVYMGQNYIFANFFRMIGMGGKKMLISSESTAFVSDSLEIVRVTDMAFDLGSFLAEKLGFDVSRIKTLKELIGEE